MRERERERKIDEKEKKTFSVLYENTRGIRYYYIFISFVRSSLPLPSILLLQPPRRPRSLRFSLARHPHPLSPISVCDARQRREKKEAEDVEITRDGRTRSTCTLIRTLIVKLHLTVFPPPLLFLSFPCFFFRLSKRHRCHGVNCRRLKSNQPSFCTRRPRPTVCPTSSRLPTPASCPLPVSRPQRRRYFWIDFFVFSTTRARLLTSPITHRKYTHRAAIPPPDFVYAFSCMMISEHKRPCAGETIVDVVARKTTVYHRNHCIDSKHYDKLNKRIEKYKTHLRLSVPLFLPPAK